MAWLKSPMGEARLKARCSKSLNKNGSELGPRLHNSAKACQLKRQETSAKVHPSSARLELEKAAC